MAQSISQEAIGATGLPGATAASRHAGATASGAPTTGTFAVGDYVVDQTGAMYVCTVAGTPGTWQLSGVSVNENIAGKNLIFNGAADIAQRGTSVSITGATVSTYGLDRWFGFTGGSNITQSQVASGLTGFQYAVRTQRTAGQTSTGTIYLSQSLETRNTIPLAGQTVTWSFWGRIGSNFSGASNQVVSQVLSGTGTDQNILSGYTGASYVLNATTTLTTSWQRFTYTATVSSTATEIGILWNYVPSGTAGANDYFDITGVQLEIAPQATPFSRAGGSIGGELALCQRYFEMSFAQGVTPANGSSTTSIATAQGMWGGSGSNVSPNYPSGFIPFKVEKRTASYTVTSYGNSLGYWGYSIGPGTPSFGSSVVAFYNYSTNGIGISNQAINATMVSMFGHWTVSAEL